MENLMNNNENESTEKKKKNRKILLKKSLKNLEEKSNLLNNIENNVLQNHEAQNEIDEEELFENQSFDTNNHSINEDEKLLYPFGKNIMDINIEYTNSTSNENYSNDSGEDFGIDIENIGSFEDDNKNSIKLQKEKKKDMEANITNNIPEDQEDKEYKEYKLIDKEILINNFLQKDFSSIVDYAKRMGLCDCSGFSKQELVYKIMDIQNKLGGKIYVKGVLDYMRTKNLAFVRYSNYSYFESSDDIYVDLGIVHKYSLKSGDTVLGLIRAPSKPGGKYFEMVDILKVNDDDVSVCKTRVSFDNLTPIFPDKRIKLEYQPEKYATRILDIFAPIGTGQRALIVAPPKAGKTMILQEIANAIYANHRDFYVIILLIDERPEEVTDMRESVPSAEVIASTFDEAPDRHVKIAELVIEKAKRLVEHKKNVVILLDSITRLARAYNLTCQTSGKVLSGGVDANALYGPKKFFGAARNIREGGSLTIIATALIETGSKMDDVIFEEFKGTGNMEVNLLRKLADKRIFPAIDLVRSSTRREELLLDEEERMKSWVLRKVLTEYDEADAMQKVLDKMKNTKTNKEFLMIIQGS
ncbi:MAG: transcription termination factor Rho [Spirochaetes bacterium]|nr:transcription termination factor Rho [Spirochaetota bacterium]